MNVFWHVALCSPPYRTFSYRTPDYLPESAWAVGQRVLVPVGKAHRVGVIVARTENHPAGDPSKLKPLGWPLEQDLLLTGRILELVRELALRQMIDEGRILSVILPKALQAADMSLVLGEDGSADTISLQAVLQASEEKKHAYGWAWMEGRLKPVVKDSRAEGRMEYELLQDPPWPVRPGAKRQLAVLEHLFTHGRCSRQALHRAMTTNPGQVLQDLAGKGLIRQVSCVAAAADAACGQEVGDHGSESLEHTELTPEQGAALQALEADLELGLEQGKGVVRLIQGVTGSGKTLLYLRLARSCLARGRSVVLLAPEVALSAQLWAATSAAFPGVSRHWYHGYLAPGAKLAVFRAVMRGGPHIVVGTRSALFLPLPDLGLIILDEEHDASYKQDEGLAYQAKEVAFFRIRQGGVLVLGSATPDIKTRYAADQGEIAMAGLTTRISTSPLPEIRLVDMRTQAKSDPLSADCREELEQVLARGEQAMFLLNRRGFAPLVSCLDCGRPPQCPHCEVGLTYHKGWERLLCHYCGHTQRFPCVCDQCGGSRFLPLGEGTEGLEEYLAGLVSPQQGLVRLDRDNTRRKGRLEEILGAFAQGKAQVMVGTQMLSKGHHFPNVTLVAAVDGDIGLNLPDYRAAEKTFQLLVQLAGRAGRGDRPGRVLIQTRNPDHPCWVHIQNGDYQGFFTQELERRRRFGYPPFVKLGMVRFSHPVEWEQGGATVAKAGEILRTAAEKSGVRVLGPAPAPLSRIKGRKRFHCLIKAAQWQDIREVYGCLLRNLPRSSTFRMGLDLDPVNML